MIFDSSRVGGDGLMVDGRCEYGLGLCMVTISKANHPVRPTETDDYMYTSDYTPYGRDCYGCLVGRTVFGPQSVAIPR